MCGPPYRACVCDQRQEEAPHVDRSIRYSNVGRKRREGKFQLRMVGQRERREKRPELRLSPASPRACVPGPSIPLATRKKERGFLDRRPKKKERKEKKGKVERCVNPADKIPVDWTGACCQSYSHLITATIIPPGAVQRSNVTLFYKLSRWPQSQRAEGGDRWKRGDPTQP